MNQYIDYIHRNIEGLKPLAAFVIGGLNYLLFPDVAFQTALYAVGGSIIIDIYTKMWAISRKHGGYINAIRKCEMRSQTLWEGTRIKIHAYLIVAILVGLSYRVVYFQELSIFVGSVVYCVMFLRELQSVAENLVEGGSDLRWLLIWAKKKEKQILESEEESEGQNERQTTDTAL